jgi:sulfocyanin
VRWIALAAIVMTAACGERERTSSADAARADSSAAGYLVGHGESSRLASAPTTVATTVPPPNDTTAVHAAVASAATPAATTPAVRTSTATTQVERGGVQPVVHAADSAALRTGTAGRGGKPDVTHVTLRPDSLAHPEMASGPVRVNEFLSYDQRSHTVSLQLIAGYNGLNGSLNYNGATNGSHGLFVPTGWRIHVAVTNRDSDLQHSAIVVQEVLPPPVEPVTPAFPGAALPELGEGLHEDETGTMDFVVTHAGHYMIACGVPGHAQAGMWLQLGVSNRVTVPAYR